MSAEFRPVLIVGGGAAGLAVACALGRAGVTSHVLERRGDHSDIDRGDVIHSSSVPLLTTWGAMPFLAKYDPLTIRLFRILNGVGDELGRLDLNGSDSREPLQTVRHPHIVDALESAAV